MLNQIYVKETYPNIIWKCFCNNNMFGGNLIDAMNIHLAVNNNALYDIQTRLVAIRSCLTSILTLMELKIIM